MCDDITCIRVVYIRAERKGSERNEQNEDEELEVLRWILFDNHKFTSYFATHRFMLSLAGKPADPHVLSFLRGRVDVARLLDAARNRDDYLECGQLQRMFCLAGLEETMGLR